VDRPVLLLLLLLLLFCDDETDDENGWSGWRGEREGGLVGGGFQRAKATSATKRKRRRVGF